MQNERLPGGNKNEALLLYRWLIFLFGAVLCIAGPDFTAGRYAIFESLAVAGIFNAAVTAYMINNGRKFMPAIVYSDIFMIVLLIFFTGGIGSELYVFLLFIIGSSGIYKMNANTVKVSLVCVVFYSAACLLADMIYKDMNYPVLVTRNMLFILAAFGISGIYGEVRKFDEMRKKEFRLARTDKLTGLANRHYLEQKLDYEAGYALSRSSVLNVIMFDLDDFKRFNDTYGHVSGDKLLILFADIIRQGIRNTDIPIRYGGEEFLILVRDLDIILAKSVGDRIRRNLEKQRIYLGERQEKRRVTASCGIAQFPLHSRNIREVIEKADKALYYAKEIGKNITVTYNDIGRSREAIESGITERNLR